MCECVLLIKGIPTTLIKKKKHKAHSLKGKVESSVFIKGKAKV